MTIFNKTQRVQDTLDYIKQSIANKLVKGIYLEIINFEVIDETGDILIESDCKEYVGDIIEGIVQKSKFGINTKIKYNEGFFDWHSDTYIKPSVHVVFNV